MFVFRLRTISEKFENRAFDNAVTFLPIVILHFSATGGVRMF